MDIVGWIFWLVTATLGVAGSIVWFLLGGWVVTLVQLVVLVGAVFVYRYGWQRGPLEMIQKARGLAAFTWAWVRSGDVAARVRTAEADRTALRVRTVRIKEWGDVNLSTLLSVTALAGLGVVALL